MISFGGAVRRARAGAARRAAHGALDLDGSAATQAAGEFETTAPTHSGAAAFLAIYLVADVLEPLSSAVGAEWGHVVGLLLPPGSDQAEGSGHDLDEEVCEDPGDLCAEVMPSGFKAWNRIYWKTGRSQGVTMLLVEKVPGEVGKWTAVDPTGRVQVLDLRDKSKCFTRLNAAGARGVEWADTVGLTEAGKQKAIEHSSSAIARHKGSGWQVNASPRRERRGRAGSRAVKWVLRGVMELGGAVFSRQALGWTGLWGFGAWRAWNFFGVGGFVATAWTAMRDTVEAGEEMLEKVEEAKAFVLDGGGDMIILAAIVGGTLLYFGLQRAKAYAYGDSDSEGDGSDVDQGTVVSDTDDDIDPKVMMAQMMSQHEALKKQLEDIASRPAAPPPVPAPAAAARPNEEVDPVLEMGVEKLLSRLQKHEALVEEDAGKPKLTNSAATATGKVDGMVQQLKKEAANPREALLAHLQTYKDRPDWKIGDSRARVAPTLLAWLYKNGRSAKIEVQEFIRSKELETCHSAAEMVLLAVILDRLVIAEAEFINSDAVEVMARRMYALYRAFEKVHKMSDWKQPRGQQGKWKTKVQWHLADEYDAVALADGELRVDDADEEVRKRLERKALFAKHLDKAVGAAGAAVLEETS